MMLFYIIYNYYTDFVKGFVNKKQCIPSKQEYTKPDHNCNLLSGK